MLCVLCLFVLWGFSLVTSYSGVNIHRICTHTLLYGKPRYALAHWTRHDGGISEILDRWTSTTQLRQFSGELRHLALHARSQRCCAEHSCQLWRGKCCGCDACLTKCARQHPPQLNHAGVNCLHMTSTASPEISNLFLSQLCCLRFLPAPCKTALSGTALCIRICTHTRLP